MTIFDAVEMLAVTIIYTALLTFCLVNFIQLVADEVKNTGKNSQSRKQEHSDA